MISLDIMATSLDAAGAKEEKFEKLDGVNLLPFIEGKKTAILIGICFGQTLVLGDARWSVEINLVQDYGYALYNLDHDLSESKNLIKSEKKRSRQMITQLNEWKAVGKPR